MRIGVGETADDLRPFEARAYARSLVGSEPESNSSKGLY